MAVAQVLSRAQLGLDAPLVQIEAFLGRGLPGFSIVGLPAPVVRESRERVRSAILNSGYAFPPGRITVNLAPVELAKDGGRYDLPVALALLMASGQLRLQRDAPPECFGELGLSGELRSVRGLLLAAVQCARAGHEMVVPSPNLPEVRLARLGGAFGFRDLRSACQFLSRIPAPGSPECPATTETVSLMEQSCSLEDVKGQWRAKRALVVAAAGGHSLLMVGPPGSGKTLLATRLPPLLPPLTETEALEVAAIASIGPQGFDPLRWGRRPFRAPHHAASANAIVGGGSRLRPGEISLAHHGVLFLDELPEFDRRVLEALREPLESGTITLARAASRLNLPAEFQLVAAMNPCPCGYLGDPMRACRCGPRRVQRYRERLSGPLLDRIDLCIDVGRVEAGALLHPGAAEPDGVGLAAAVRSARCRQLRRQQRCNARLDPAGVARHCRASPPAARVMERVGRHLGLSARGFHRLLKVARTIADLEGEAADEAAGGLIGPDHITEAASFRLAAGLVSGPFTGS